MTWACRKCKFEHCEIVALKAANMIEGGRHCLCLSCTGLDTCLAIMKVIYEGTGDSKYRPCPLLRQYVDAGMPAAHPVNVADLP